MPDYTLAGRIPRSGNDKAPNFPVNHQPVVLSEFHTNAAQDETDFDGLSTNGTFTGGSGYDATDTITLNDGTVITVDAVSSGVVTEFTVTTNTVDGKGNLTANGTLTQASTSGGGSGFSLTLGDANETATDVDAVFDIPVTIYVGNTGDVDCKDSRGVSALYENLPDGSVVPMSGVMVVTHTTTTATGLIAVFS